MADTKEVTLYNDSKATQNVYDASGQVHSMAPGEAVKITMASAEAKRLGHIADAGGDLKMEAPKGVQVRDRTAEFGAPDPEAAYQPRNPVLTDVERLEAEERERQERAAAAAKEGRQLVGGQKPAGGEGGSETKTEAPNFDKMTGDQLKEYAETNKIDLGDAKKVDDIRAKVKAHKPAE